ncbi:MAG: host-nuclease inhibitor Gam family protein [Parcubacteria group bacterium]
MQRTLTYIEDVDANVAELAELDTQMKTIEAEYQAKVDALLVERNAKLVPLMLQAVGLHDEIKQFVDNYRSALPFEGKTLKLPSGRVFYRDTPGRVVLANKRLRLQVVMKWLGKKFRRFVRTVPETIEIDREAILREYRENPDIAGQLRSFLRIVTEEKFYVHPDRLSVLLTRTAAGTLVREPLEGSKGGSKGSGKGRKKAT